MLTEESKRDLEELNAFEALHLRPIDQGYWTAKRTIEQCILKLRDQGVKIAFNENRHEWEIEE